MVADAYSTFFNYRGNAFFNKPSTFGDDGGFYESLTYGLYTLYGFFQFAEAWKRVRGDETLLLIPQLRGMADQLIHCFYPGKDEPLAVNFGDCGDVADHPEVLAHLAHVLNDPHAQWFYRQHCPSLTTPQQMLWHRSDLPAKPPDDLPTCRLFRDIGWGMLRTGWSQEHTLLAVKCGDTWNHALDGWETDAFIFSELGDETPQPKLYALHNASYLRRDRQVFFDSVVKALAVVYREPQGYQAIIQTQPNVLVRIFAPQRPGEVWVNGMRAEDWRYEEEAKLVIFRLPCEENVVRIRWEV